MSFKKSFTLVLFICVLGAAHNVWAATTWYVRMDGGTSTQCTGTANAPYSGSGTHQPCALNHPVWVIGAGGTQALWHGGDTLIIDDTNHTTGAQAQYKIGSGMPNTTNGNCAYNWSYNCTMAGIPSGPDAAHPTKILGTSYSTGCGKKPQLWGSDGIYQIFDLSGKSNIDMECLEITDHSNCGFRVGNPVCTENWNNGQPSGPWARTGIYAQGGSNFTFKNMDVHGMANRGFLMGGLNGVTFSYVNMDGNYMSNWDGDVGESGNVSYNSGNIVLDNVKNRFAGCSEAYPRSSTFNTADYTNCTDQNDSPGGYGDGLGMYVTGGNWVITNSEFSHNTQDGLDLLYHDSTGSVSIQRSLFEGNDGNQVKISSPSIDIENSVLIGNCSYLADTHKVKNTSTWISCRAGGDTMLWSVEGGGSYKFYNSTIYSAGNSDLVVKDNSGTCNGTETYTFRNNIYQGNGTASLYINQLTGNCLKPALNTDYSIIDNVAGNVCPSGSHNKCATDPKWLEPISQTASSNLPNVYLQSDSPAIGAGEVIGGLSAMDFNDTSRGSSWNMGAIQNVSSSTTTGTTSTGTTTSTSSGGTTTLPSGLTFHSSGSTTTGTTTSTGSSTGSGSGSSGSTSTGSTSSGSTSSGSSSSGSTSSGSSTSGTSTLSSGITFTSSGSTSSGSTSTGSTSSTTGTSTGTSSTGTSSTGTSSTGASSTGPSTSTGSGTTSLTSTIHFTSSGTSSSSTTGSTSTTSTVTPPSTTSNLTTTPAGTVKINNGAITFTSN